MHKAEPNVQQHALRAAFQDARWKQDCDAPEHLRN